MNGRIKRERRGGGDGKTGENERRRKRKREESKIGCLEMRITLTEVSEGNNEIGKLKT